MSTFAAEGRRRQVYVLSSAVIESFQDAMEALGREKAFDLSSLHGEGAKCTLPRS